MKSSLVIDTAGNVATETDRSDVVHRDFVLEQHALRCSDQGEHLLLEELVVEVYRPHGQDGEDCQNEQRVRGWLL